MNGKKNILLAYALISFCLLSCTAAEKPRPNLVFILVDDQGYYDLGCYGGTEFDTPHIDRMAEEGVRFTDYYAAAPICSPSLVWQPGCCVRTRAKGSTKTS